jgi:hypothetical protein
MRQHPSCRGPKPGDTPEISRSPKPARNPAAAALERMALGVWLLLALAPAALAHPIPDVPLRSFFEADGSAVIKIELETRCFSQDPVGEPYLFLEEYLLLSEVERDRLRAQALEYVGKVLQLSFEPGGAAEPHWKFEFTTFRSQPLTRADDPVVLTGSWRLKGLSSLTGYQARSLPEAELSLLFLNYYQGEILRGIQVLFPGETSRILNLSSLAEAETGDPDQSLIEGLTSPGNWATLTSFIRSGFVHVVPLGMDHILFVLGLFLLSRHWKPLLLQVTAFTLAHTLTLGLAAAGMVQISAAVVEPVIAGSIVVIALENIFYPRYSPWRLAVVFVFGLVHGLGFAGALSQLDLPASVLLVGLLGFNLGVELGQLAVIAAGLALTIWLRDPDRYRKAVVIPGSLAIAAMGAYWMVERLFF